MNNINLEQIKTTAENYYRNGDFYCSEAIVKTLIDAFEVEVSDDVIKMASGFPVGIGGSGCTCGAVAGGVMFLGLIFGRKVEKDPAVAKAMELSAELHNNFVQQHKSTCCRALTKNMTMGSEIHMNQCIAFTGEVAYETAKIALRELQKIK